MCRRASDPLGQDAIIANLVVDLSEIRTKTEAILAGLKLTQERLDRMIEKCQHTVQDMSGTVYVSED
jgi:hypothetical protein